MCCEGTEPRHGWIRWVRTCLKTCVPWDPKYQARCNTPCAALVAAADSPKAREVGEGTESLKPSSFPAAKGVCAARQKGQTHKQKHEPVFLKASPPRIACARARAHTHTHTRTCAGECVYVSMPVQNIVHEC